MYRIDAHQHFWNYNPETHKWIDDSMRVLKRNFSPKDLQEELHAAQFDGCVSVQASQTEDETQFLLDYAKDYSFIRGVVGWLDLRDPNIEERLDIYCKFEKLKGLRHVIQDEPDDNFMLKDDFLRGISLLSKYNFTYDLLIFPRHLEVAVKLVHMFPRQRFVLDHIAKPDIKNGVISPWQEGIEKLASHTNVYCKLSGMVTEASWRDWKCEDFIPYLDVVFNAFGEDRLMIGSDWPVCTLAGNYTKVMSIVEKYLETRGEETGQKILGKNAIHFYRLDF